MDSRFYKSYEKQKNDIIDLHGYVIDITSRKGDRRIFITFRTRTAKDEQDERQVLLYHFARSAQSLPGFDWYGKHFGRGR